MTYDESMNAILAAIKNELVELKPQLGNADEDHAAAMEDCVMRCVASFFN